MHQRRVEPLAHGFAARLATPVKDSMINPGVPANPVAGAPVGTSPSARNLQQIRAACLATTGRVALKLVVTRMRQGPPPGSVVSVISLPCSRAIAALAQRKAGG